MNDLRQQNYPLSHFWVAAGVVTHCLWTSAAPIMSYPIYAATWGLSTTTVTAIFAIYPIVVVAVLIFFGNLSDQIGLRASMLVGVSASVLGVLCFALASNASWLFTGRIMMGLGVGISAGPATAAMVEYSAPRHRHRASAFTTLAQAIGLVCAASIGGVLIRFAPFPLHLNFWILFAALLLLWTQILRLPTTSTATPRYRWRPRTITIQRGSRRLFLLGAGSASVAFILGGIVLALGAQIAHDLVGSSDTLVNAAVMSLYAIVWAFCAALANRLSSRFAILLGSLSSIGSTGLLALAASTHSIVVFVISIGAGAVGYSLAFMGGLAIVNDHAPQATRGSTLSALYLVIYLMQGVSIVLTGYVATHWGLSSAVDISMVAIVVLCIAVIASMLPLWRRLK